MFRVWCLGFGFRVWGSRLRELSRVTILDNQVECKMEMDMEIGVMWRVKQLKLRHHKMHAKNIGASCA